LALVGFHSRENEKPCLSDKVRCALCFVCLKNNKNAGLQGRINDFFKAVPSTSSGTVVFRPQVAEPVEDTAEKNFC
jgi:hypothetical protein